MILLSSFNPKRMKTYSIISKLMYAVNSVEKVCGKKWNSQIVWEMTMTICRGKTLNTNLSTDWSQHCCCCSHLSPSGIPLRSCWRWRLHHQFSPPHSAPQVQGDSAQQQPLWVCPQSCLGLVPELQTQRWDQQQFCQPQLWRTTKENHIAFLMVFKNIAVFLLWIQL